jgi:hypothetical protein
MPPPETCEQLPPIRRTDSIAPSAYARSQLNKRPLRSANCRGPGTETVTSHARAAYVSRSSGSQGARTRIWTTSCWTAGRGSGASTRSAWSSAIARRPRMQSRVSPRPGRSTASGTSCFRHAPPDAQANCGGHRLSIRRLRRTQHSRVVESWAEPLIILAVVGSQTAGLPSGSIGRSASSTQPGSTTRLITPAFSTAAVRASCSRVHLSGFTGST